MSKDSLRNLTGNRRSVWFDVARYRGDKGLKDKSDRHYSSKTSMFIDDVTQGVFPPPGLGSKKYRVEMEATGENCHELLRTAIERQYPQHDLTESIYWFAQECVQCIAAYGQAPYEIVYFSDEEGLPKAFSLNLIIPASFVVRKDGYKQYVPASEVADQDLATQFIDLPAENILLFELPAEIRHQFELMMESLSYFGGAIMPEFAMKNLVTQSIPFSQSDYFRSRQLAVAYATKDIGWNARDYGTEYELEFYVWYRQLKFNRFQCLLRSLVIETLNEGLARIGKRVGFKATISIEGLPTVADADRALDKLLNGDCKTFLELLKPF